MVLSKPVVRGLCLFAFHQHLPPCLHSSQGNHITCVGSVALRLELCFERSFCLAHVASSAVGIQSSLAHLIRCLSGQPILTVITHPVQRQNFDSHVSDPQDKCKHTAIHHHISSLGVRFWQCARKCYLLM